MPKLNYTRSKTARLSALLLSAFLAVAVNAQAPSDDELKELERQIEQQETEQADAKKRAAAEAKRKAEAQAKRQAEAAAEEAAQAEADARTAAEAEAQAQNKGTAKPPASG